LLLAEELPNQVKISMAHNGVLFLDELPEFKRDVLEVHQPLEDREVTISRRNYGHLSFVIHVGSQYESSPSGFLMIQILHKRHLHMRCSAIE
jgi:magnesium chelatase family protein